MVFPGRFAGSTGGIQLRQEKAQDKASEMDALRAKRAMEAAERQARQKEEGEKAKMERMNADAWLGDGCWGEFLGFC